MPTDSGNEDLDESPQDHLRQAEETGEIWAKTKISRAFGIALIVIVGLAIVALVITFGSASEMVASSLHSVAQPAPSGTQ